MNKETPVQYQGLLTVAQLPRNNQEAFNFDYYDITPIDHDYAGQFQLKANHVFRKLGLPIGFVMMVGNPEKNAEIYEAFRRDLRYLGGGTGSGFKNRAPAVLDELDPLAKLIGAINVVVKVNGRLRGYNTDGLGFVKGLQELLRERRKITTVAGLRILILGAGGTADAIAFSLAAKGATLTILNRTAAKAENLAERICQTYGQVAFGGGEEIMAEHLARQDVIINASTKGAEGSFKDFVALAPAREGQLLENIVESAEMFTLVNPKTIVCDINLRADESPTLLMARKSRLLTQDGAAMNFHQAIEALWLIHEDLFVKNNISKKEVARLIHEVS